jgi:hypothetical protein
MNAGDTFLAGEDEDEKLHLRIVATPPNASGEVAVVSLTTRRRHSESLVTLHPGDHPFVQHESVIAFGYSEINTVKRIEQAIASGKARKRAPVSAELLRRIQDGLLDSDFTPNGVRQFVREALES